MRHRIANIALMIVFRPRFMRSALVRRSIAVLVALPLKVLPASWQKRIVLRLMRSVMAFVVTGYDQRGMWGMSAQVERDMTKRIVDYQA